MSVNHGTFIFSVYRTTQNNIISPFSHSCKHSFYDDPNTLSATTLLTRTKQILFALKPYGKKVLHK